MFILSNKLILTPSKQGGSKTHTLTLNEIPKHSHTRGTMEIEGSIRIALLGITDMESYNADKALQSLETRSIKRGSGNAVTGSTESKTSNIKLKASSGWTGSTSEAGSGNAHSIIQPYITTYFWKRKS